MIYRVVIETPFAAKAADGAPLKGTDKEKFNYLRACILDSLSRGEAPFASHGFYTLFLDDASPRERAVGIQAGLAWGMVAVKRVFYVDLGVSPGMLQVVDHLPVFQKIEVRRLPKAKLAELKIKFVEQPNGVKKLEEELKK
jgi:hypothetical protein